MGAHLTEKYGVHSTHCH